LLIEHLPYELEMLEWSYAALHDDQLAPFRQHMWIVNLAIEEFWTHARNLVEFFDRHRNGSEVGSASASNFVSSRRFDQQLDLEALMGEINNQITHLQYDRPSTPEGKLNIHRMAHVKGAIEKAVKLFEADMTDDAKAIWKPPQQNR